MVGTLILATDIPDLYRGLVDGWRFDPVTMVVGYVVMRTAMILMCLRAVRGNPGRAGQFRDIAWWTAVVQLLWVATCFVDPGFSHRLWFAVVLIWLEVAERHGLLLIISLGEIVVGTAVSVRTLHELRGWWQGAASALVCGISLALSMWWLYFGLPLGEALHRRRGLAFRFGYLHFAVFASIAAVGAGLQVMALREEGQASRSPNWVPVVPWRCSWRW